MERANVEKILVMLKDGKIEVEDALNLIEAVVEEKEEKEPMSKKFERAKENVKNGFVKAGHKIGEFAEKVDSVGKKCAENIREEFNMGKNKNNDEDEEIVVEEVKTEDEE